MQFRSKTQIIIKELGAFDRYSPRGKYMLSRNQIVRAVLVSIWMLCSVANAPNAYAISSKYTGPILKYLFPDQSAPINLDDKAVIQAAVEKLKADPILLERFFYTIPGTEGYNERVAPEAQAVFQKVGSALGEQFESDRSLAKKMVELSLKYIDDGNFNHRVQALESIYLLKESSPEAEKAILSFIKNYTQFTPNTAEWFPEIIKGVAGTATNEFRAALIMEVSNPNVEDSVRARMLPLLAPYTEKFSTPEWNALEMLSLNKKDPTNKVWAHRLMLRAGYKPQANANELAKILDKPGKNQRPTTGVAVEILRHDPSNATARGIVTTLLSPEYLENFDQSRKSLSELMSEINNAKIDNPEIIARVIAIRDDINKKIGETTGLAYEVEKMETRLPSNDDLEVKMNRRLLDLEEAGVNEQNILKMADEYLAYTEAASPQLYKQGVFLAEATPDPSSCFASYGTFTLQ
jgi:hypothetical protein